jgi:hypothetical protein
MTLFPVFIAICIAAVFHGVTIASGATAFRRALLGYVMLLIWWLLIVYYYNDLRHPVPEREVVVPAVYNLAVYFLFPGSSLARLKASCGPQGGSACYQHDEF